MAKVDVWMPVFIGSYLADTMHLTTEQHGAYFLLLMYGWRMEGKIPADEAAQASICRLSPPAWKKIRPILKPFFVERNNQWTQKRQMEELGKAESRRESAKVNGERGGRPKGNRAHNPEITGRLTGGFVEGIPTDNPEHNRAHNPQKSSSPSPSDPPYSPPHDLPRTEFQNSTEAMYRAFGIDTPSHRDHEAMYGVWLELVQWKADVPELARRVARYRTNHPGYPVTPKAILNNWHSLKADEKPWRPRQQTEPAENMTDAERMGWQLD